MKSFLKGRRLDDYGCTCRNELKNIGKIGPMCDTLAKKILFASRKMFV